MSKISSNPSTKTQEMKQLYAELLAKEKALQDKDKELDRFSHVISHDLKAPISQTKLIVYLLKKKLPPEQLSKEVAELLDMLSVTATQMTDIIDTIHAYSKSGLFSNNTATFSLKALLDEVANRIKLVNNVKFHFPDEAYITANRSQLFQVLFQLVDNAVQYNHLTEGNTFVNFREEDEAYFFEVIDDGPGIPEEYHENIFQIFNKGLKRSNGRAGVGLSIANKIVENAGGALSIESKVGKGTKFWFTWPKTTQ